MKFKLMCTVSPSALVVAAVVSISPACAESTVSDAGATIGGVGTEAVVDAGSTVSESKSLIAERPSQVQGDNKNFRFKLKVDMDAHPTGFFPDLWPNQNLPTKKHVDKALVSEIARLKSEVKIPRGAAIVGRGGGTSSP